MTIVVTGGSGFIGTELSKKLLDKGHTVVVVDIKPPLFTHERLFFIACDISVSPLPYGVLEKADAVINFVGKSIFTKWNPRIKTDIENSRIQSTKHITEGIRDSSNKPSCFICASAIGFYGDTGENIVDEQSSKGNGFLSSVVYNWEKEAQVASQYGVRVVCVRMAPVLGYGGMLNQIKKTSKLGFLLKLKKQDFWMSWIHIEDIINTYVFALETTTVQVVFNASSPNPVSHYEFMRALSKVLNRRVLGSIPRFLSKWLFGEFFTEITKNQRVIPKRLIDKGFVFSYPKLEDALRQILKK